MRAFVSLLCRLRLRRGVLWLRAVVEQPLRLRVAVLHPFRLLLSLRMGLSALLGIRASVRSLLLLRTELLPGVLGGEPVLCRLVRLALLWSGDLSLVSPAWRQCRWAKRSALRAPAHPTRR